MSFFAKYCGECPDCNGEIQGCEVEFDATDSLVHTHCDETDRFVMAGRKPKEKVCSQCHLIHAGECF